MSVRGRLGALACAAASTGCATSLSLALAPTVDGTGRLGTEHRVEGSAAVGTPDLRFHAAPSVGVGYLGALDSSYVVGAFEAGVEGGRAHRWSVGGLFGGRRLQGGLGAFGGGLAGQWLFLLAPTHTEGGGYRLGVRASLEGLYGDRFGDALGRPGLLLAQVALVLRWTTFDTTGKRWF